MINYLLEFTGINTWTGYDGGGREFTETGPFVSIEWKYFEGWNIPFKIVNGERESFESAHTRVIRWLQIPFEERHKLRANFLKYENKS